MSHKKVCGWTRFCAVPVVFLVVYLSLEIQRRYVFEEDWGTVKIHKYA